MRLNFLYPSSPELEGLILFGYYFLSSASIPASWLLLWLLFLHCFALNPACLSCSMWLGLSALKILI